MKAILGAAVASVILGVPAVYLLTRDGDSGVVIEETATGYDLNAVLSQPRTSETSTSQQEGIDSPPLAHQSSAPSGGHRDEGQHQGELVVGAEEETEPSPAVIAPVFAASDVYGEPVDLASLRGQVVILTIAKLEQGTSTNEEIEEARRTLYENHKHQGLEAIHVLYKSGFLPVTKAYVESRVRERHEEQADKWTLILDWSAVIKKLHQVDESLLLILDATGAICYAKENDLWIDADARELILKLLEECASSIDIDPRVESE